MAPDPSTSAAGDEQMCTVADWLGGGECLRVAQWRIGWADEHPVFLCNFHAEPFVPLANHGSAAHA